MKLTKSKIRKIIKEVFNERVSMQFVEHLNSVIKELDYMISVGADDDVYDNPKQSVKLIKTARQLLGKVR